ncbi:MAG: CHASE2 domain-containing protein, partial [Cyanobacteria bacterium P01_H01_bin.58]
MKFPWYDQLKYRLPEVNTLSESVIKLSRALAATSVLVTSCVVGARYLKLMEAAELAAYDQLMQIAPDEGSDDRILVVGITEDDLQQLEEWPISDRALADAVQALSPHQPAAIAIDVFRDFPHEPGTQMLQAQVQQNPNTLIICKVSAANDIGTPPPPWLNPDQVGFSDLVIDPGGILRRSLLMAGTFQSETPYPKQHLCNEPGQVLLSLSFRATLLYLQTLEIEPSFNEAEQLVLGSTVIPKLDANIGGYQNIDNAGYQLMLNYRSARNSVTQVSLMEVINGDIAPELIQDRIVFIGYTTPQAKDDFYTPYSSGKDDDQKMPGVVVHAQSASQLLATVLDGRSLIWAWPLAAEIGWIFAWSIIGGLLAWYLRHPGLFALVILGGVGSLYGICWLVFTSGGWIPLVPPIFTFVGTAVGIVSLDRFNNSAYGQNVYRKVKTFLRLEIEIDEGKVGEQVSEIVETDYFRDLQAKAKAIRKQPSQSVNSAEADWPHEDVAQGWHHHSPKDKFAHTLDSLLHSQAAPLLPQDESASEDDDSYDWQASAQDFNVAKHLAQAIPKNSEPGSSESLASPLLQPAENAPTASLPTASENTNAADDDYETTFLQAIAQEAALIQAGSSHLNSSDVVEWRSPPPSVNQTTETATFSLEADYCQYLDRSSVSEAYLQQLTGKLEALKA